MLHLFGILIFMSLTSSTKVTLSLSAFGALILGIITFLSYVKADSPTSNKESVATPAIQNIQNNNNFSNPLSSSSPQNYQNNASDSNEKLVARNAYLESENAQLRSNIVAWKKHSDEQSQEINRLNKVLIGRQEAIDAIAKLNKDNSEYFKAIQTEGMFTPTAEQKADYRNAIAQNIELIKGYQAQLRPLSN